MSPCRCAQDFLLLRTVARAVASAERDAAPVLTDRTQAQTHFFLALRFVLAAGGWSNKRSPILHLTHILCPAPPPAPPTHPRPHFFTIKAHSYENKPPTQNVLGHLRPFCTMTAFFLLCSLVIVFGPYALFKRRSKGLTFYF